MENSQNRDQVLKILFASHPDENGFWFTSDDQAFTDKNKHNGQNHSATLKDQSFEWVPRDGEAVEVPAIPTSEELSDDIDTEDGEDQTGLTDSPKEGKKRP